MSDTLTTARGPLPTPQANVGYLFRLAFQRFRIVLEEALEPFELSSQEYGILSLFETRSELSTSELARVSQVTRQTMHTAVLGLERSGLVERRSKNRRGVVGGPPQRGREPPEEARRRRGRPDATRARAPGGGDRARSRDRARRARRAHGRRAERGT